eukprot:scaffold108205_cov15-Tisochrysis_lutea.AAC.1
MPSYNHGTKLGNNLVVSSIFGVPSPCTLPEKCQHGPLRQLQPARRLMTRAKVVKGNQSLDMLKLIVCDQILPPGTNLNCCPSTGFSSLSISEAA